MAFAQKFQHDVFISYAHADNESEAWVSQFVRQLECALKQRLGGTAPKIFFDDKCLHANHQLEEMLEAVRNSAIFVAVASRAYAIRPWTRQELETFAKTTSDLRCLFAAECLPLSAGDIYPEPLESHNRLPFWRTNELHSTTQKPLNPASEIFYDKIHDLAEHISEQLKILNKNQPDSPLATPLLSTTQPSHNPDHKYVLLAQVIDDLDEEREQIRRYLQQFNITVLPEDATYPQGGNDFKTAFCNDLTRADYFVQLLGAKPGKSPPDLPEGYTLFQYGQAAAKAGVEMLHWRHPELVTDTVQNPGYRNLLTAATVMSSTLESFKAEIVKRCQTPAPKQSLTKKTPALNVFINADLQDLSIAKKIQAEFSRYKFLVAVPMFDSPADEHRENLNENLIDCDVLILVHGNATPKWVQGQLRYFNKMKSMREQDLHTLARCMAPPYPKPDICIVVPDMQEIDCKSDDSFAELHAMIEELCL